MRLLLLSLTACLLLLGAAWAQNTGESENMPQLPVGQTFKQFEYPMYQDGKLKATLSADTATGITLNRAETSDLIIKVYDNGAVTTTITSPKADLLVNEQKMRTKNTVDIERADMSATSQDCDFDLKTKRYLLRTKVRVLLKHLDLGTTPATSATTKPVTNHPPAATSSLPVPLPAAPMHNSGSMLDSPGAYSDTNTAPIPPSSPDSK